MSKKTESLLPQANELEQIATANHKSMQTVLRSYNVWLRSAGRVQAEMLKFINKRVCEDMKMPERFAGCECPEDIVEQQMSFSDTMLSDYADESRKILGLMTEAASDLKKETDAAFAGQGRGAETDS